MAWFEILREKLNPAQEEIMMDEGAEKSSEANRYSYVNAYEKLEVVSRGVNFLVDASSEIQFDIMSKLNGVSITDDQVRLKKLKTILNFKPNPYINADEFKRNIYMDIILEGDAFVYWDGAYLYNIPAKGMKIHTHPKTFIEMYEYERIKFKPNEIIHIRENSSRSIYRGTSRLKSADKSVSILHNMNEFQDSFFRNGTVPGLVLKTKNTLSRKIKDRIRADWIRLYNPKSGGRRPIILDSDFDIEDLGNSSFKELDFAESIVTQEKKILKAIGIPPILLDAGNNANISPNYRLFYTGTVIPLVIKVAQAFEVFFGYDLKPVYQDILALRPELRDEAAYYSTLVNAGIMTRNEARAKLRLEKSEQEFADELVLPANIAGSAVDGTSGGRPAQDNTEE